MRINYVRFIDISCSSPVPASAVPDSCKTGCLSGEIMINHLMYADDLVLLSPSATGLRELLRTCEKYSKEHAIYIYNSVLTCRQNIINSSASAPLNATRIAVKKVSDVDVCMFGPEL